MNNLCALLFAEFNIAVQASQIKKVGSVADMAKRYKDRSLAQKFA